MSIDADVNKPHTGSPHPFRKLVITKVDSRLAIDGIEHVNAGILHEFLAPWQLGRGKSSRRFFKSQRRRSAYRHLHSYTGRNRLERDGQRRRGAFDSEASFV